MFQQVFKNIDDVLWKDAGCSTELDYAEQSSWILFLKWLDDNEKEKITKAKLDNKTYKPVLDKEFQWSSWAVVKTKDGKVDFNKNLTGPDLKKFVDEKLFPYLSGFRDKAESIDSLEYKIGEIFSELKNKRTKTKHEFVFLKVQTRLDRRSVFPCTLQNVMQGDKSSLQNILQLNFMTLINIIGFIVKLNK